jgi:hypothetical protein
MAQTQRRRKKHRGTQGGSIDRRGRTSRPRSRQEARARARRQLSDRRDLPPTWGSAVGQAGLGGVIFFFVLLLFGQPAGGAAGLAALMFLVYIPMGFYIQQFMWRRRQRANQRQRDGR